MNAGTVTQMLTVNKASLIASVTNVSKSYGMDNPDLPVTYMGFMNSDESSTIDVPPIASTSANKNSSPGNYPIILSGGVDNNYNISLVSGFLSVTKANIMATAENKSKTYGEENPNFTIQYEGFVDGENSTLLDYLPTAYSIADKRYPSGSYLIYLEGGIDNNYNIFLVNGYLNIDKATVTAVADDKTKQQGTENPEFTISYSGFVNGEDKEVLDFKPGINCVATTSSGAGEYPIIVSGGYDNNYDFIYFDGTLTIQDNVTETNDNSKNSLLIFPNPAKDLLKIKTPVTNNVVIEIADINGQLIYNQVYVSTDDNFLMIDISEFPSGVYSISIQTDQGYKVQKFIKQ